MDLRRRASLAAPKFERERLEKLFNSLDVNKDGSIDTKELQEKLEELGIDASEAAVSLLCCLAMDVELSRVSSDSWSSLSRVGSM